MPLPTIANAAKVTVKGELFGQLVENVWFVGTPGLPSAGDLSTICGIFQTGYVGILAPLSEDLSYGEFTARYLGDVAGPEFTLASIPAEAGGTAQPSSPGSVALCVSLRTSLAGRRFRGRKYFSGIPENAVAANVVDPAVGSTIVSAINDLITALAGNDSPLAIVSYAGLTVTGVTTALLVDNFVDSQRRRLTGRGR